MTRRVQIRERREASGLSVNKLARLIKVAPNTALHWDRGTNQPNAKYLPLLADLFGCSIDDLFA